MSQENVELVQSMYPPGDPSRFFELLDEEVEVDLSADRLPDYPNLTRGKDAVIDLFRHYWGTWDDYVLEATEFIDAEADRVVVVESERGRGRGSGAPFEVGSAMVWTLGAGKVVRAQRFKTREEALESVGFSE